MMSYEKNEFKFVNFKFGADTILIKKIDKKINIKSKAKTDVHISGVKVLSDLEILLYFTYKVNYSNIVDISMNGRCNLISFGAKAILIRDILKSDKNSDLYKNNKPILDVILVKIKQGCFNNVKRIAEKNGIKFVEVKNMKNEFKDVVYLDGDENLI